MNVIHRSVKGKPFTLWSLSKNWKPPFLGANNAAFDELVLTGTGGTLDGSTVAQILAAANTALGGGGLPSGYTFGGVNDEDGLNVLITNLNEAFDNGVASGWAVLHLVTP